MASIKMEYKSMRYIKKSPLGYFHLIHELNGSIESRVRYRDYDSARSQLKWLRHNDEWGNLRGAHFLNYTYTINAENNIIFTTTATTEE